MLVKLAYTVLGTNRMPGKQSVSDSRRHCGAFRTLFRVSALWISTISILWELFRNAKSLSPVLIT